VLATTSTTPEQVAEAVRINEDARIRSLRAAFLILAAISLLAIFPATQLPNYLPAEVPEAQTEPQPKPKARRKKAAPAA
jgi:hypothetical protein